MPLSTRSSPYAVPPDAHCSACRRGIAPISSTSAVSCAFCPLQEGSVLSLSSARRTDKRQIRRKVRCAGVQPGGGNVGGRTLAPVAAPALADLRRRREEILAAAAARGAHRIRVFGSVARGEASASSDVD